MSQSKEEVLAAAWNKKYGLQPYEKSHLKHNYEGLVLEAMDNWAGHCISHSKSVTTTYEIPKHILAEYCKKECIALLNWLVENNNAHVAVELSTFHTTNNPEKIYDTYSQAQKRH